MKRFLAILILTPALFLFGGDEPVHLPVPPPPKETAPPPPPPARPSDLPESEIRARFLTAYQTSRTPELKAQSIQMLQGLKEVASLRMLTGMLGATDEDVRRAACDVMTDTDDPDGYFVKWLIGALNDSSPRVRAAAARALSREKNSDAAIKSLAMGLMFVSGEPDDRNGDNQTKAMLIHTYDQALEKLTGEKSIARDSRGLSNFWMDYWKRREAANEQAERKLSPAGEPQRREGLARDSFDKTEPKNE